MPATYVGLIIQLRIPQLPLKSGISGRVVEVTFNVQTAGLALEKDVISLIICLASLPYSRSFGLSF